MIKAFEITGSSYDPEEKRITVHVSMRGDVARDYFHNLAQSYYYDGLTHEQVTARLEESGPFRDYLSEMYLLSEDGTEIRGRRWCATPDRICMTLKYGPDPTASP